MDNRPYISGLDSSELSNILKRWFKHGHLDDLVKRSLSKDEELKDCLVNLSPNNTELFIYKILEAVEGEIRQVLCEYANDLEGSRLAVSHYIDGLKDYAPSIMLYTKDFPIDHFSSLPGGEVVTSINADISE